MDEIYKKQIKNCDKIIDLLSTKSVDYKQIKQQFSQVLNIPIDYETLQMLGLNARLKENGELYLNSRNTLLKDEIFCIVDIESTGSISKGEIIEIGAIKLKNGEVIDEFESLIYASEVPENIYELTGINTQMLTNAPKITSVLEHFRLFLADSIFVAHNVSFDYGFLAKESLKHLNTPLINQRLCTIMLARRCIKSEKYGLDSLKTMLDIKSIHHRALSDAKACGSVLLHCIEKLKSTNVKTTKDLLDFAKSSKNLLKNCDIS